MLKLKVCGMRNRENIIALSKVKPEFIGFIFHEKSSRNISDNLIQNTPDSIIRVGVFVDKNIDFILDKIKLHNLNCVQLHGKESTEFCAEIKKLGVDVIKAFNISEKFNFSALKDYEETCNYFLFDAAGKNAGGNGIVFNWALISNYTGRTPFLLSGGIDETMTKTIKELKHPLLVGVDINSGFETKPAVKNITAVKKFSDSIKN
jgi:phosphoribosylanthranilate isomerase